MCDLLNQEPHSLIRIHNIMLSNLNEMCKFTAYNHINLTTSHCHWFFVFRINQQFIALLHARQFKILFGSKRLLKNDTPLGNPKVSYTPINLGKIYILQTEA